MLRRKSYLLTLALLLSIPLILTSYKYVKAPTSILEIAPKEVYQVSIELDITQARSSSYLSMYWPQSNERQSVLAPLHMGDTTNFEIKKEEDNQRAYWDLDDKKASFLKTSFLVEGRHIQYQIPKSSPFEEDWQQGISVFLKDEAYIQVSHPRIVEVAQQLKSGYVLGTLQSNFDYLQEMETSHTRVLTDALSALELNRASCNGKSRLFVALCRSQGIPARVVGGTILENTAKRTSHLWAEIFYQDHWIPFDVLNGYFAELPAHYLELYKGDLFLFKKKHLDFDYQFIIQKKYTRVAEDHLLGPHLWPLLQDLHVPLNLLRTLLLLPFAGLLISICRNVVGMKTFGIWLPALIGLSLVNVSFILGLGVYVLMLGLVALLHLLFERWSLLYIPKVSIILTVVILVLLALGMLALHLDWKYGESVILLPIVILSITAERFAKTLHEEKLYDASKMLGNTIILALLSTLIFESRVLLGVLLTYPELYLVLLVILLLLGKWIGMRFMEYFRFAPSLSS